MNASFSTYFVLFYFAADARTRWNKIKFKNYYKNHLFHFILFYVKWSKWFLRHLLHRLTVSFQDNLGKPVPER